MENHDAPDVVLMAENADADDDADDGSPPSCTKRPERAKRLAKPTQANWERHPPPVEAQRRRGRWSAESLVSSAATCCSAREIVIITATAGKIQNIPPFFLLLLMSGISTVVVEGTDAPLLLGEKNKGGPYQPGPYAL